MQKILVKKKNINIKKQSNLHSFAEHGATFEVSPGQPVVWVVVP